LTAKCATVKYILKIGQYLISYDQNNAVPSVLGQVYLLFTVYAKLLIVVFFSITTRFTEKKYEARMHGSSPTPIWIYCNNNKYSK